MSYETAEGRDVIKDFLKTRACSVTFTKVDGTQRVMRCTLNGELIEQNAKPYERKTDRHVAPNDNVQRVFDLEQNAWRSFRWDALVDVDAI